MNSKKLIIAAVLVLLAIGGAGFGLYTMKMNADSYRAIEVSVKGVEEERVNRWVKAFQSALAEEEVLDAIVNESSYGENLRIPADGSASHLKEAAEIKFSKRNKTIQVGVNGKRKQEEDLDAISRAIFKVAAARAAELEPDFGAYYRQLSEQR